jgi:hypothetical protein
MAIRGAKPKPSLLRIVDGTNRTTRHGSESEVRELAATGEGFGPLKMPSGLKAKERAAWKRYVAPAGWLDASKETAAIAFVRLWVEFDEAPRMFNSARHGQLRAYMSELGLTDERNRKPVETKQADEFFGD